MPAVDWGWLITPEELESWVLYRDSDLLVINKPPYVVCHPSKHGPWSSLIGACRAWLGVDRLHMPSRLDRETSGVVVFAINPALGSALQRSVQDRRVEKQYYAILCGQLPSRVSVNEPIGKAPHSAIHVRRAVLPTGQSAETVFEPVKPLRGYTSVRALPVTGRMHQIRVHAAWLGHAIAGDKLYGPDELLFLEFREHGFAGRLPFCLPLRRHALHACAISFDALRFAAPITPDLLDFERRNST